MDTIRAATDFSPISRYALERAVMLARASQAPLEVVHVIPASAPGGSIMGVGPEKLFAAKVRLTKKLKAELRELRPRKLDWSAQVLEGGVAEQLIGDARAKKAALLVLGFRGQRPLRQRMLGGTTERLVERSPSDILVVKKRARDPYRKVLVASDLGPNTRLSLERVAAFCEGADVELVHVHHAPFETVLKTAGASEKVVQEHRRESISEAKGDLRRFVDALPPELRPRRVHFRRGHAADVIVDLAEKSGFDLVVMGRNRGRASELFIGSITKRVLRAAQSDVLVVVGRP